MSEGKQRTPDFSLIASPGILFAYIEVFVEPEGWLARLLWRFIKKSIRCNWSEIPTDPVKEV